MLEKDALVKLLSLGAIGLLLPGAGLPIGHLFQSEIAVLEGKEKVQAWRSARFSYRIAQFSPLFWQVGIEETKSADSILSKSMYEMILRGNSGAFSSKQHLQFLETREDKEFWARSLALAHLRYGAPDKALSSLDVLSEGARETATEVGIASALALGDQGSLNQWLGDGLEGSEGLYFLVDSPPAEASHFLAKLARSLQEPSEADWKSLYDEAEEEDRPLVVEGYARWTGAERETLMDWIPAAPDPSWSCALLSSLPHLSEEGREEQAQTALAPILAGEHLFGRLTIATSTFCHPEVFVSAQESLENSPTKSWLGIFSAQSYLGQYQIDKSQKALRAAEEQELDEDQKKVVLFLRSTARELAGDIAGMEKYARTGTELDKSIFSMIMGKAALLGTKKTEAIWLLHSVPEISLPPTLKGEYDDLCAVAQRVNGSAVKIKLHDEEIAYGMLERSADFRLWFSGHLNKVTQLPHRPIPAISILINNPRVERDGTFLLETNSATDIDPVSIVTRSHMRFLFNSLKKMETTQSWKDFTAVRQWLELLPFPQLLRSHPEAFSFSIETID
jgi:hypothetical protein